MPRAAAPQTVTLNPHGHFGRWITDPWGQAAYDYTCDQQNDPAAAVFTTQGPSRLHWHQVGNDRLTAIATNRGEMNVLHGERGLQWLNRPEPRRRCPGAAIALVQCGESGDLWTDLYVPGAPARGYERVFGQGYFRKGLAQGGLRLNHHIAAPFGDDPVLLSELTLTNTTTRPRRLRALVFYGVNLHFLDARPLYTTKNRKHYLHNPLGKLAGEALALAARLGQDAEEQRHRFAARFRFTPHLDQTLLWLDPKSTLPTPPPHQPAEADHHPLPLFLAFLGEGEPFWYWDAAKLVNEQGDFVRRLPTPQATPERGQLATPCLCGGVQLELKPGQSHTTTFLFGVAPPQQAAQLARQHGEGWRKGGWQKRQAMLWKKHTLSFSCPDNQTQPWLGHEPQWHAYGLRSALLHDSYFENHWLPQGVYEFLQGLRGAPRDLAHFIVPLIYLSPARAREVLRYLFRLMTPQGRIMYSAMNFGQATGAVIHEDPSDLSLFLFWAATEYVFFTGDQAFLDEPSPFYPKAAGAATHRQKLLMALDFLRRVIGLGPHGLCRAGSGDWSDGISFLVKNRFAYVKHGESAYSTAMALYTLPRLAALLRPTHGAVAAGLDDLTKRLRANLLRCFNGRWVLRGYDGQGRAIGQDTLFLEHHVWLLIARALPREMARSVIAHIKEKLDDPCPFGQALLFPPGKAMMDVLAPGSDVNGGTWAIISALLTWGYGQYDPALAWRSWQKNALAQKAHNDPAIWYGIWSGPDSFNAPWADRPGETFFHPATPCTDFPVMNLNVHAGQLLSLIKLCGVEPGPGNPTPKPLLPFGDFALNTPTFSLGAKNGAVTWRRKTEKET